MMPISTVCTVGGMLAALAFSANLASAGTVTIHTTVPPITVPHTQNTQNIQNRQSHINVNNFSSGASNPANVGGSAPGGASGKVDMGSVHAEKPNSYLTLHHCKYCAAQH